MIFIRYVFKEEVLYARYFCGTDGAGATIFMDVPVEGVDDLPGERLNKESGAK